MADQTTGQIGGALRSAPKAAREVAADAYASLDLCHWCSKAISGKFCTSCHRGLNPRKQEELESQKKGVHTSNVEEKKARDVELLRKINEVAMVDKTMPRKEKNRE